MSLSSLVLFSLLVCFTNQKYVYPYEDTELTALMELKTSLDPDNHYLSSWDINAGGGHPCSTTFFEGVACNEIGQVSNISLQGKGLSGMLSPAISGLKHLTGLYLHYNSLHGEIPREIGYLTQLTDLYLDVNNLSGYIPPEIGNIPGLQVLQLCYNQITGSIPTELGSLNKLSVLALQSNHLSGAIPASLGELGTLVRVDLSFNQLFGSIPTKLADAPLLEVLDVRNNTLSGNVPPVLKRLDKGFLYENNLGLCGIGFPLLAECSTPDDINPGRPESVGVGPAGLPTRDIPESVYLDFPCNQSHCSGQSKSVHSSVVVGSIVVTIALSAVGVLAFTQYRRRKSRHGATAEMHDFRLSTDQGKGLNGKNGSPLASLEYTRGWDPLANDKYFNASTQEIIQSFRFNLEEVEAATQYFSEATLLGKNKFCATYKGILRDGSVVAIKSIGKTSCKSEESEFLKGLNMLSSLRHENLVRLRGFCCSKSRGECFLIYDFVPNGSLLHYLDATHGDSHILEWSARVSIVKGIAKGIAYLHSYKVNKPALIHQNISAEKVLIDQRFNPQLSDSGLYKLLTNDIIFSALKARAAMGYIAPEYTTTGRFTDKSDVYAFGVLVLQIISGKRRITSSIRLAAESCRFQDFIDSNLNGRYFEYEAAKLAKIANSCTHESPIERPSMDAIVQELGNFTSCF